MPHCNHCKAKIKKGQKFCPSCGIKIKALRGLHLKHEKSSIKKSKKTFWIVLSIILAIIILSAAAVIFAIPFPYEAKESYYEKEPYTATEYYYETEAYMDYEVYYEQEPYTTTRAYSRNVPVTEEECRTDISLNPMDYVERGLSNIDALLGGDINALLQTCQNVIGYRTVTEQAPTTEYRTAEKSRPVTRYRDVQKSRPVTRYRDVYKERQVTKYDTLFNMWAGTKYYFNV